jgi:leader peptidase (prepilin peptidase) / N-methyltransferase
MVGMGTHDISSPMSLAVAGIFGLLVGSFLNVVAYRVPLGLSVSKPRSFCPDCRKTLAWWENVPLGSWIVLRGRCRGCGHPISFRYPAVELATGAVFTLVAWGGHGTLATAGYCCLAASMIAVLLIELGGRRAPLSVAAIGAGLGLVLLTSAALSTSSGWMPLLGSLAGMVSGFAALVVLRRLDPTADDPRTSGRSALPIAGCWLGGLGLAPLVAAAVIGVGTYTFCLVVPWIVIRQRVRTASGEVSSALATPVAAPPLAVTLALAMLGAWLTQMWR